MAHFALKNGAMLVYLHDSWELSDIKGTLCKDLSPRDSARQSKNMVPEEEAPQADWNGSHPPGCVYAEFTGCFLEQP